MTDAIETHVSSAPLSVSSACRTLDIARSTFYRYRGYDPFVDTNVELRDRVQKVALEWPSYGYRRITHELLRRGVDVGLKTVLRLMREDNLLCLRTQRFRIATTDSDHGLPTYKNRAKDMVITGCDQLWAADITYIRLGAEFIYMAMVMDAYSRKIVGWSISRRIDTRLALDALEMALLTRPFKHGHLVHHSDRGSQYASFDYQKLLERHGIRCSMSRRGNCLDNAPVESFFGTLKNEHVHHCDFESVAEARAAVIEYIENFYNSRRRHSALGYRTPMEYEAETRRTAAA